jgi:hypothetical protein
MTRGTRGFDARPAARNDRAGEQAAASKAVHVESRPNLARIMSVSGITVALVAAAAMGAEHAFNPVRATFDVAENGTAVAPIYTDAPVAEAGEDDGGPYRRMVLLERQIGVFQERLRDALAANASFAIRVSTLEERLSAAEDRLEAKQIVDRVVSDDREATAERGTTSAHPVTPHVDTSAGTPDAGTMVEAEILTGSINPAAIGDAAQVLDDLSRYASAEARDSDDRAATQTQFALGLDLFDTIGELKDAWSALGARLGDALDGLEARALHQGTEAGFVRYRLVIGPFANAADAAGRCAGLKTRGIHCSQTVFGGEPIEAVAPAATHIRLDVVGAGTIDLPVPASVGEIIADPPFPQDKPARS